MPGTYDAHHRRSIRLPGYDYAQTGAYFVTICAMDRACLFGEISGDVMNPSVAGLMVQAAWDELPLFYPNVGIDAFVVMPNHIHGIITLVGATPCGCPEGDARPGKGQTRGLARQGQTLGVAHQGQTRGPAPTGAVLGLGDVVQRLKTITTTRYTRGVRRSGWRPFRGRLWQRNYYEHVVREEDDLNRIREYIHTNPLRWALDPENPAGGFELAEEKMRASTVNL